MAVTRHEPFGACAALECGPLRALIAPGLGMSLVEFSLRGESLLDLSRRETFLACRKGLGPLILPHFNLSQRVPQVDLSRFPHAAQLEKLGVKDPFQHGVGRYAPWEFEEGAGSVSGKLSGDTRWNGYHLREITGYEFQAKVTYSLGPAGLEIAFDLSGGEPVQAGIHFYYDLKNRSTAEARLPLAGEEGERTVRFEGGVSQVFTPRPDGEGFATYRLETEAYTLDTTVRVAGDPEETFEAVVLFSPEGERFACVEPLSALTAGNRKQRHRGRILLHPAER